MKQENIFDLTGKVALVTGGSRGLGRAFCEIMAKYGADVACSARDMKKLEETKEVTSKYGRKVILLEADVNNPDDVQSMVDQTVEQLGKIDILINNAGITAEPELIHKTPIEEWDRVVNTNLRGQFLCMRAVLPEMLKQKSGSIINLSSIGAFGAADVAPVSYGASKAAIIQLTRFGAMQYGKFGIRVNCIAPGLHITDLGMPTDAVGFEERVKMLEGFAANFIPLGRTGQPMELEGLAILLASDASNYITGSVFVQDGGKAALI